MTEYKQVTYGKGWAIRVTPEDRAADVMHHLITGGLLGGRTLDGVTWEEAEGVEYAALRKRRANMLAASMRETKEIMDQATANNSFSPAPCDGKYRDVTGIKGSILKGDW